MIAELKFKVSLLCSLAICLILIGCSSKESKPSSTPISNVEKVVYRDLSSKYKQLFKQNIELRKRLQKLEEKRQTEINQSDKTIKNLGNTIQLLELNLKQMNNRLKNNSERLTQLSAKETKAIKVPSNSLETTEISQNKEIPVSGLSGDFKTPDNSKAIKTIPLLPNTTQNSEKSSSNSINISKNNLEESSLEDDSASVFVTKKPKSAWEDPDLNPPSAPIKLKIVSGAKRKYQQAFKTYSNRDFKDAIRLFSDFIKRYPSDMDADNSQYWIGQSYYQLEDYLSAEHAFRKVLRNYPHNETKRGYKTPDAILMLGRIYTFRNQPLKGRYYFEQVINRFPDSRSAAKAKREIQSMSVF